MGDVANPGIQPALATKPKRSATTAENPDTFPMRAQKNGDRVNSHATNVASLAIWPVTAYPAMRNATAVVSPAIFGESARGATVAVATPDQVAVSLAVRTSIKSATVHRRWRIRSATTVRRMDILQGIVPRSAIE